jgi:opacity protein-like surface antigen
MLWGKISRGRIACVLGRSGLCLRVYAMTLTRLLQTLSVTMLLVISVVGMAHAQTSRLYFAGYMGLNTFGDLDFSEKTVPTSGSFTPDNAFSFAGALGLRINNTWRVEAEASYRSADMGNINFGNGVSAPVGGSLSTYLLMANVYYDLDLGWQKLTPYLTAGLGLSFHDGEIDDTTGFGADATDSDFGVAWQVGTGLKYRVTDDMAFTGGYRYLGTSQIGIQGYDMDYSSHEIRVGLEYDLPFK